MEACFQTKLGALETLSKRVAKQSKRTTDQMHYITNKITESSEASSEEFKTMIHYISSSQELTGTEFSNEINELKESMNAHRDIYVETMRKEHEEYLHRLREREDAFQDMMLSFRDAAASKQEKKWWQKWKNKFVGEYPLNIKGFLSNENQQKAHHVDELLVTMDNDHHRVDFRLDELESKMEMLKENLKNLNTKCKCLKTKYT